MKPDIEQQAEDVAEAYHTWLHGTRLKHSTPELARFIARALLDAHQRGRREGVEEVYPLLERLRSWIEDEVYAELPFTAEEQDAFDAIRAKAQEVKT